MGTSQLHTLIEVDNTCGHIKLCEEVFLDQDFQGDCLRMVVEKLKLPYNIWFTPHLQGDATVVVACPVLEYLSDLSGELDSTMYRQSVNVDHPQFLIILKDCILALHVRDCFRARLEALLDNQVGYEVFLYNFKHEYTSLLVNLDPTSSIRSLCLVDVGTIAVVESGGNWLTPDFVTLRINFNFGQTLNFGSLDNGAIVVKLN